MFFLKKFYQNKLDRLNVEMELLEIEEERLSRDIVGMKNLIKDPNLANQTQINISIYYKLLRNLESNNSKQLELYTKISKLKTKV